MICINEFPSFNEEVCSSVSWDAVAQASSWILVSPSVLESSLVHFSWTTLLLAEKWINFLYRYAYNFQRKILFKKKREKTKHDEESSILLLETSLFTDLYKSYTYFTTSFFLHSVFLLTHSVSPLSNSVENVGCVCLPVVMIGSAYVLISVFSTFYFFCCCLFV